MKTQDKTLIEWMEKTDISVSNLTLIKSLLSKKQTDSMTASDLQGGLGVTLRTANRIMNKLVEGGAAEEVGVEQSGKRGAQVVSIKSTLAPKNSSKKSEKKGLYFFSLLMLKNYL